MARVLDSVIQASGTLPTDVLLKQYLELYWLRPEVALWRLADATALQQVGFCCPDLDLGCGNGFNSLLLCGGRLPLETDEFIDVAATPTHEFLGGTTDIYDTAAASIAELSPAEHRIRIGLDWKQNLLDKAARLKLYESLVQHDANAPLPFSSRSIRTIFSNTIYWIERVDVVISEMSRVLTEDGTTTVLVPDNSLREAFIHARFVAGQGWDWMDNLDKGRHAHMRHFGDYEQWQARFDRGGLKVLQHTPYISSRLNDIHEVGLRPLSPPLIRMANLLSPADRVSVKQEWVDHCMAIAKPMIASGWLTEGHLPRMFHAFVLGVK